MAAAPPGFRYIDIHTHLHPEWLWAAIRRWFTGRAGWEFRYGTDPDWVARFLAEQGVERFVFFSYAHKPGLARELNAWLHETGRRLPRGLPLGTVHPGDPDVVDVAEEALDRYGFKGFKFHINVQRFHPDDPRILPVYERLIARGAILLIHVGSAPWPNEYDGFPRFARVMTMFPEMKVIVAHMGQWETRRHLELMSRCSNMYLDTAAAMAPGSPIFLGGRGASPADVTDDDLVRWQDRIVFGSDFPNTPHSYEDERRPIWERPLPPSVHRKIFHDNAERLLGL
ncbi:MAG TPA: amidohydrolase family protein [Methylomirabilota bacterium]